MSQLRVDIVMRCSEDCREAPSTPAAPPRHVALGTRAAQLMWGAQCPFMAHSGLFRRAAAAHRMPLRVHCLVRTLVAALHPRLTPCNIRQHSLTGPCYLRVLA